MQQRISYLIHLADNALILGHRNSEWCGHGPVLEQDIAMSNIALDLIGQARMLYQHAATLINTYEDAGAEWLLQVRGTLAPGEPVTEDSLAYLRDVTDFSNCLLVEQPNGDWAVTITRQFFMSVFQLLLYEKLQYSRDSELAAIAAKSLKEVAYHVKWSSEWVIRLGDGTEESRRRILKAISELWPFTGELFQSASWERETGVMEDVAAGACGMEASSVAGYAVDYASLKEDWMTRVAVVFEEATLDMPAFASWHQSGGKEGRHTEYLGYILAEMQFLQRAYPGSEW
ncbi:1,2-phenylacetyl-CoA epoxidase subunit PaaC [Filimonas effusa]|uniref:Phenylacetate-CoA oxygenase subunit PaaI n=1 Tax=Filimonas effusa TaxID=2508721 RepID=A0A4Q1D6G1_9BACT|nr:1,2-phenylacetyl-CoA epoxidase subunit PaaC [Filimonas effusa]RXK83566.1 phenylacetate-CoA oxygenase subunit PaaI [Filimonas effusa]